MSPWRTARPLTPSRPGHDAGDGYPSGTLEHVLDVPVQAGELGGAVTGGIGALPIQTPVSPNGKWVFTANTLTGTGHDHRHGHRHAGQEHALRCRLSRGQFRRQEGRRLLRPQPNDQSALRWLSKEPHRWGEALRVLAPTPA
jgi:hypothetical protein